MNHEFELSPDFQLLRKYNYITEQEFEVLKGQIVLVIPSITNNKREWLKVDAKIRKSIDDVIKGFQIQKKIQDSLLYVCIAEAGFYQSNLISAFEAQMDEIALKQMAKLIDALKSWDDIKSIIVKTSREDKTVKVDHVEVLSWLPKQLANAFSNQTFFIQAKSEYQTDIYNRNWDRLKNIKPELYKKIKGVQQANFIQKVLTFIKSESIIRKRKTVYMDGSEADFIRQIGYALKVFDVYDSEVSSTVFIRSILKYRRVN